MLMFDHNHNYFSARSLSHNSISEKAEFDYVRFFKSGMSVTDAYNAYRVALTEQVRTGAYGSQCIEAVLADASICPTERQVRYLYAKFNEMEYGAHNGFELWNFITSYVTEYKLQNDKCGGRIEFLRPKKHGNEFILVISTPLMTRGQQFAEESKMIFVDSTGSLDSNDLVVTLFMIATGVGELPVGITVAGSKSQESYTSVF